MVVGGADTARVPATGGLVICPALMADSSPAFGLILVIEDSIAVFTLLSQKASKGAGFSLLLGFAESWSAVGLVFHAQTLT